MIIEFAPMEGVTDVVFRRAHFEMFGGVDRYFLPFISPTSHLTFSRREQEGVSPLLNRGIPVVPRLPVRHGDGEGQGIGISARSGRAEGVSGRGV